MLRIAISCAMVLTAGVAAAQQAPSQEEQAAVLNAVRYYALSYTQNLPNYTCTETIHRTVTPVQRIPSFGTNGIVSDSVEAQLSLVNREETRRIDKVNGKPVTSKERADIPGAFSRGEFATLLDTIFQPSTHAELRWDRAATLNRRKVNVIAFTVPQASGYGITRPGKTVTVPFRGLVFADAETNAVLRIEMKCFDIPRDAIYQEVDLTLDYKSAQVAGETFILPSHYSLHFGNANGEQHNQAEYTSYRKFGADTKITFDDAK